MRPGNVFGKTDGEQIIEPLVYVGYQRVGSLPYRQWEIKGFRVE